MKKGYEQALGMARDYLAHTITLEMMHAPFHFSEDITIGYSEGIERYFMIEKNPNGTELTTWGEEKDVRQWLDRLPEPLIIQSFCNQFDDKRLNTFEILEECLWVSHG